MTNHLTYADPSIAAKQHATVESQLDAMWRTRRTHVSILFRAVGEFLRWVSHTLPSPITLLDAGCGSAYYSEVIEYFIPNHYSYTGIDYNPGMVALAHKLYPRLTVEQGDLCNLHWNSRSFNVVLSSACIAHIDTWQAALSELTRVADSYLLLHRNPIYLDDSPTIRRTRRDYGVDVWVHRFNEQDLIASVDDFDPIVARNISSVERNEVTRTYLFRRKQ